MLFIVCLFFFQGRDDRVQQERRDHDEKRLPDDPLQNHRHEKVHAARGPRQVNQGNGEMQLPSENSAKFG